MRPRNIPIALAKGTSKDVTLIFGDLPDLTFADIQLIVKRHAVDEERVLVKTFDSTKSVDLANGSCVFTFTPEDTSALDPRTYVYEVHITLGADAYVPLLGDFPLFNTIH